MLMIQRHSTEWCFAFVPSLKVTSDVFCALFSYQPAAQVYTRRLSSQEFILSTTELLALRDSKQLVCSVFDITYVSVSSFRDYLMFACLYIQ